MSDEKTDEKPLPKFTAPDDDGLFFFPERSPPPPSEGVLGNFFGRSSSTRQSLQCIRNVYWCAQNDPAVKLLIGALKSHGCHFDLSRHVSCEDCVARVDGGYDPKNNQVVVCKNTSSSRPVCCSVLAHELIHMFDFCRAKADFTNLEHLACTEIRAAAIMHCSFMSAWTEGDASLFNIRQRHQECTKKKAQMSVMMVRYVDKDDARAIVEKVFTKCYKDLEPFGRIPRRNSLDRERALAEADLYGYCKAT